jgi:hypothetical protein
LEPKILLRLQEAQRDLESGKTLPKFLRLEDQSFTIAVGEHAVALPARFIRLDDDNLPHYTNLDTFLPQYLESVRSYSDAVLRVTTLQRPGEPAQTVVAPRVFVIRNATIDFVTIADQTYSVSWSYYRGAVVLSDSVSTNDWLTYAPEWLIGEAGFRLAKDLRDTTAVDLFDDMRQRARAASFGELIADEDAGGPIVMGSKH